MRTTRSLAKNFCLPLETTLESLKVKKKGGGRRSGGRMPRLKAVNNPWGNRGRKKCNACRTRKRGCFFDSESSPCRFCAASGIRCGAKVFAEKARYYRSKSGDEADVMGVVSCRGPSESIAATDDDMDLSVKDASVASSDTEYVPPSEHTPIKGTRNGLTVKVTRFKTEDDIFNISSPTSHTSNQSSDCVPQTPDYNPSFDTQPSYIVPSNSFRPSEDELLPLYTDDCGDDDEFLEYQMQFTKDDPFQWSPALTCIQRYA